MCGTGHFEWIDKVINAAWESGHRWGDLRFIHSVLFPWESLQHRAPLEECSAWNKTMDWSRNAKHTAGIRLIFCALFRSLVYLLENTSCSCREKELCRDNQFPCNKAFYMVFALYLFWVTSVKTLWCCLGNTKIKTFTRCGKWKKKKKNFFALKIYHQVNSVGKVANGTRADLSCKYAMILSSLWETLTLWYFATRRSKTQRETTNQWNEWTFLCIEESTEKVLVYLHALLELFDNCGRILGFTSIFLKIQ